MKMSRLIESVTMVALLSAATLIFAQASGEATYKAKCLMCHGATGNADTPAGKALKVKPFSDPEAAKLSTAAMISFTKNGMGKMPPFKGKLSDAEITEAVAYCRAMIKK